MMRQTKRAMEKKTPIIPATPTALLEDLRQLIEQTRRGLAVAVNASLTLLYWRVGKRIKEEILRGGRAEYGQQILPTLSAKLTTEYGPGWKERNLAYMIKFVAAFPDEKSLHALCAKLSWSHFRLLIGMDDPLKRDFYTEMCRIEGWSTRMLEK